MPTSTAEKDDTGYGPFYYMLQKDTEWKAGYKYTYNVTITLYGLQVSVDTGSMTWGRRHENIRAWVEAYYMNDDALSVFAVIPQGNSSLLVLH